MRMLSNLTVAVAVVAVVVGAYGFGLFGRSSASEPPAGAAKSIYDIDVLDIDGNRVNLSKFRGNVVMFVNTASKCGYTPQYEGLQNVYKKYKDRGFVILGFPANNFGGQEPGSNEEIKEFCTLRYKVSFPMFAKISVKGADQHPLYRFLTGEDTNPKFAGEITWNFNKFLANDKGEIVARFASKETPESAEVTKAIEKALAKKAVAEKK